MNSQVSACVRCVKTLVETIYLNWTTFRQLISILVYRSFFMAKKQNTVPSIYLSWRISGDKWICMYSVEGFWNRQWHFSSLFWLLERCWRQQDDQHRPSSVREWRRAPFNKQRRSDELSVQWCVRIPIMTHRIMTLEFPHREQFYEIFPTSRFLTINERSCSLLLVFYTYFFYDIWFYSVLVFFQR